MRILSAIFINVVSDIQKNVYGFESIKDANFKNGAYQRERKRNFRKDVDILNYRIKKLEDLIKNKEAEEVEQVKRSMIFIRVKGRNYLKVKLHY